MTLPTAQHIEKRAIIEAPIERVWQAISSAREFGAWFGLDLSGQEFAPGAVVVGKRTEGEGLGRPLSFRILRMEAPTLLSYRWRPHDMERAVNGDDETTVVEFRLEQAPGGQTLLRILETGFEAIPTGARSANYKANDEGWDEQLGRFSAYLAVPDAIEKRISINAPRERVWAAISAATEFGAWFGADFGGAEFVAGSTIEATITDPPEYAGTKFPITVVAMEPPRLFSFRWHPYEVDSGADLSSEPTTLIEFVLEPEGSGTRLTVTESGFHAVPADRRSLAFRMNEEGWAQQVIRVKEHVGG
jgi:uncharacterized protein YndB with AHSA1/START domain